MRELVSPSTAETEVKKSRFLAEVFRVDSQEAARAELKSRKGLYRDATHVVHAFVIGETGGILGSSDDGEPSGTAGRPVLDALRGSGLTNAMVTVTRWYGGTQLGTGGLARAYGDAAKGALAACESREIIASVRFEVSLSYDAYERLKRELADFGAEVESEEFAECVSLRGTVPEADGAAFSERVANLSAGRSRAALSR
jgi:uncharacterized YigZ family protein